ncbi:MAG: hypothetical protein ACRDXX_09815 [Stackebrandtia sp.]
MDRQNRKVLSLYRRHVVTRLRYAYSDGDIGLDEYERLHQRAVEVENFTDLKLVLRELRTGVPALPSRWRIGQPPVRSERKRQYELRWWKPEQMWGMGIVAAILIGAAIISIVLLLIRLVMALGGAVADFFSAA